MLVVAVSLWSQSNAQTLSPRQTNPISWQHMLPTGEAPGWLSKTWVDLEVINGNHWAAPATFRNRKTNKELTFTSDFEQTSLFAEMGKSLSKKWAVAVEVPYAARHEGKTSDRMIDQFHKLLNFDHFSRPYYPYGEQIFETSTDGQRRGPYEAPSGSGNFKFKVKYWPVQWKRNTGWGFSAHVKTPFEDKEKGMTSGGFDYSLLTHLAFPFGQNSGIYTTLGGTYTKDNWMFKDWPRKEFHWMVDSFFDLAFSEKWGIILGFALHSPLMEKKDLDIVYKGTTQKDQIQEKIASGYHSLVEPRGQQTLGIRRRFGTNNMWMVYILEDWGPGDKDNNNDMVYSSGQPDFALGFKLIYNI